jgi:hypothetical protein
MARICLKLAYPPGSHKNENTPNSGDDFFFSNIHILCQKIFPDLNFFPQKSRKDTQTEFFGSFQPPKNFRYNICVHNGGAEFLQSLVQKFLFFHVTPGK